uniref:RRM domain-containing protein n=1 Tax=Araucaria cunninghamii TaxID=56994 RepID=A0A0D6R1C0_ARACU
MTDGGKLWAAYREFEQALHITMEESDNETKAKQVDRIRNIFRRQLSVPLADIDLTLEDYKAWEQLQGNVIGDDTDPLAGMHSNVILAYRKAVEMYKSCADYEEKLAGAKGADADRLQNYLNYINFEKASGDPARVQLLYERAITDFPVVSDLWLGYTNYLDSSLKVPHIAKAVYARAVQNCPWVEALWAKYMLALERFDAAEEELSAVFEQSLQCRFSNTEEYLDLFLTRADGLRRRIMKLGEISNASWLALLRETFQRAVEYLSAHLNYKDQFLRLHAYWAHLEVQLAKDMAAARGVWESLIKMSGGMLEVWQGYIDMELALNNVSEARALYKRCYSKRFKGNGSEAICEAWIRFEREYGSLEDLERAVMKVTPRLEELRLFQQQQEAKSQGLVESAPTGQKAGFQKSTTDKEEIDKDSSKHLNSVQSSRKRKAGVGYNEENVESKRPKQLAGKGPTSEAPDREDLGLNTIDNPKRDTVPGKLVSRGSDQQTGVANLGPVKQAVYTDECTAFASNLAFEATEEHIRQFFGECGGVKAIRLLRDKYSGKSRGLAYIDFENEEKLFAAVAKNKEKLLGKRISIARSNPKESKRGKLQQGTVASSRGGQASSGRGSGTRTEVKHESTAKAAAPGVQHRRGGHVKLTGSNTFAMPRNVARPLGWGAKESRTTEPEETPKSNEEFRKMFLKS